MKPILLTLAEYSASLDVRHLPDATIRRVDWVLMDLVASTFAALGGTNSQRLWRYAEAVSGGTRGACQLWGTTQKAAPAMAAMVNGANGYEAEFDDGNTLGGHWGSSCIPAILAVAERDGAGADHVIAAVVAAYEVGDRISHAFSRKLLDRGVHFPGMMGVFGATAGTARMLGLSPTQTAQALAMTSLAPVAPYHPGLVGADSKAMYSGWPNQCAVQFAQLAAVDYGGQADLLEGEKGLAHLWGWEGTAQSLSDQITGGLGSSHAIDRTYFKPFPCCRWLHAAIQAVGDVMQRHAVDADHIASIVVAGPSLVGMYMTQAPFATGTQAKYSLPYCTAVAAFDEQVGQPSFEADRLVDARLIDLSGRVAFQVDDVLEKAFPESFSIKVTITTRDGGAWTSHQFPKWSAERPPSFDELVKKFTGILQDKCSKSIAEWWIDYFQRGLRADASMHGFFDLMRASVVHA